MANRPVVNVHADDLSCDAGEDGRTVALARRDIQHILAGAQIAGDAVAMQVLERDLTAYGGRHAFTREGKLLRRLRDPEHPIGSRQKIGLGRRQYVHATRSHARLNELLTRQERDRARRARQSA